MKIRLAGDPNTRYDNERHDKRFEHIHGKGSGRQGGDDTENHAADSYFRAGDRAKIIGLSGGGEIYNDHSATVTRVDDNKEYLNLLLDRP